MSHPLPRSVMEERRRLRERLLEEELRRLVDTLKEDPRVERIIVFGSFARGDVGLRSDLDVVVVARTTERFLDRIGEFLDRVRPRVGIDLLAYTPDEWMRMRSESRFGARVEQEGKVVYERPSPA